MNRNTDPDKKKIAGFAEVSSGIYANSRTIFLNSVSACTGSFTDSARTDRGGSMQRAGPAKENRACGGISFVHHH